MVMTAGKVLVVEDEPDLREILVYNLKREGFKVYASGDGWESLLIAQREKPDVVLLDLMLPTMDGLEVCRKLRAQASYGVHVIIVSARNQEEDILRGLELGADDYVGKPFSLKEIVARIRTVLRRVPTGTTHRNPDEIISHPPLSLSTASHEVHLEKIPLQLTATEYRLLHLLMSQPGRIFNRQQMLAQVGEQRAQLTGRNIDVHVRALRRKFGHHAAMIDTARGVGYRFVPNPIESPAPAPAC